MPHQAGMETSCPEQRGKVRRWCCSPAPCVGTGSPLKEGPAFMPWWKESSVMGSLPWSRSSLESALPGCAPSLTPTTACPEVHSCSSHPGRCVRMAGPSAVSSWLSRGQAWTLPGGRGGSASPSLRLDGHDLSRREGGRASVLLLDSTSALQQWVIVDGPAGEDAKARTEPGSVAAADTLYRARI